MTDKRKKHVRALMKKTGMTHQAANNVLASSVPQVEGVALRTLEKLLGMLHVSTAFPVSVGRVLAVGRSADPNVAAAHSRQLAEHQMFYARSGAAEMIIAPMEMDALLAAGAGGEDVQMFRSFSNDHHVTFSDRCGKCRRWIWYGEKEHASRCFCGNSYRMVFDLVGEDWSLRQGRLCMECGTPHRLTEPSAGRNPWDRVNEWQERCASCPGATAPVGIFAEGAAADGSALPPGARPLLGGGYTLNLPASDHRRLNNLRFNAMKAVDHPPADTGDPGRTAIPRIPTGYKVKRSP